MVKNRHDEVHQYTRKRPQKGYVRRGKRELKFVCTQALYDDLYNEAVKRNWPLARVIVFRLEATVDGIE